MPASPAPWPTTTALRTWVTPTRLVLTVAAGLTYWALALITPLAPTLAIAAIGALIGARARHAATRALARTTTAVAVTSAILGAAAPNRLLTPRVLSVTGRTTTEIMDTISRAAATLETAALTLFLVTLAAVAVEAYTRHPHTNRPTR